MMFIEKLKKKPIIAGIRDLKDIPIALEKEITVIFLVGGDIVDLMEVRRKIKSSVSVFFHLDLIKGVGKDMAGIEFLNQKVGVDGIITTHTSLIRFAKKEGLLAVQRMFILDSEALKKGLKTVEDCKPDAIEVLPGIILPKLKNDLAKENLPPVIAGGLIRTEKEVRGILNSGALAISTSNPKLWSLRAKKK